MLNLLLQPFWIYFQRGLSKFSVIIYCAKIVILTFLTNVYHSWKKLKMTYIIPHKNMKRDKLKMGLDQIICFIVIVLTLKNQFLLWKVTAVSRAVSLKPAPSLLFLPHNAFFFSGYSNLGLITFFKCKVTNGWKFMY